MEPAGNGNILEYTGSLSSVLIVATTFVLNGSISFGSAKALIFAFIIFMNSLMVKFTPRHLWNRISSVPFEKFKAFYVKSMVAPACVRVSTLLMPSNVDSCGKMKKGHFMPKNLRNHLLSMLLKP